MILIFLVANCTNGIAAGDCAEPESFLDSRSFHVIDATQTDIDYSVHPPTSGPHTVFVPDAGIHTEPILEPDQVAALEHGMIIIQYDPAKTSNAERDQLHAYAGIAEDVIVAPAAHPIAGGQRVALTAWGTRQLCDSLATPDARAFIRDHLHANAAHKPK